MYMRTLFLICILCLGVAASGQQRKIDSLHRQFRPNLPDSAKAKLMAHLAEVFRSSIMDSAIHYGQQVMNFPDTKPFYFWKAAASNSIGYARYFKAQYPEAITAFNQYYDYSSRLRDKKNMAYALNNEGNIYIELGDYGKALSLYQQALQLRRENNDVSGIAMSYNNIGFIYKDLGDYEKAVSNFLFALQQYEKLNDLASIAITNNYLGAISFRQKDYAQSLAYQERAYAIQKQLNDRNGQAITLQYFASIHGEQQRYSEALNYFMQAQQIYTEVNDQRQLGLVKSHIGELYSRQQMHDRSVPYFMDAIDIYRRINNSRSLASIYLAAANSLIEIRQLATARNMIDSAVLLTKKTQNKEHQKTIYEVESKYHAATGDYKQALQFASQFNSQKDVLLNEANIKSLRDMQVKYETEKKQQEIALLHKDNDIKALEIRNQQLQIEKSLFDLTQNRLALSQADLENANNRIRIQDQNEIILQQKLDSSEKAKNLHTLQKQSEIQQLEIANRQLQLTRRNVMIGFLAAILVLGILLGFSYYRRYRLKQEARMQAAVLRQQELATKAVLEAEEAERQRIAKDLHDGVGQMMSAARMNLSAYKHEVKFKTDDEKITFEKIISLVDESCKEVRAVSHNMMPNALLKNSLASAIREFIDKLDHKALKVHLYTEGLDERLDSNTETVLYRVIQECVNNVIKHSGADTLDISVIREDSEITATVEDNGRGFDINDRSKFEGIGLKNIRTRVEYLKGTVDFDSTPSKGTLVALHVPVG